MINLARFFYLTLIISLHIFIRVEAQKIDCKTVRIADIGWTDIAATTATLNHILRALNYEPKISLVSTPVSYKALKNNDLDVSLGNWMPTMEKDIRPYLDEGSVIQLAKNLEGARFSLAVPGYVYDAGITSVKDLDKHKEKFNGNIYAIEPGNDGNRLIIDMINDNAFSLGDWQIVESSEQGMLITVKEAIKKGEYIVFLGWEPHPMNINLDIRYLRDAQKYFGENFGESSVYTVIRKGLIDDCPNLVRLLRNVRFHKDMENKIMDMIVNHGMSPHDASLKYIKENEQEFLGWLKGVSTFDGKDATKAYFEWLSTIKEGSKESSFRLPLGEIMERGVSYLTTNFSYVFRSFSLRVEDIINKSVRVLLSIHPFILMLLFAGICFLLQRSIRQLIFAAFGFFIIYNLGLWKDTLETLVLVLVAASICMIIGVPTGILCARRKTAYRLVRPLLDLMQTIPTFVYLIPSLMLFGLGMAPGLVSTIIFSIAAPIRLTYLGIKSVPKELIDAALSFGATRRQLLFKVEIPHALSSIMAGFTQCIMLSLSMVVIAALVGADGLGVPVIRALNTVDIEKGFESGLAIVILAIILDRALGLRKKKLT